MSLCGVCYSEIEDGKPKDEEHLSYDHCEDPEAQIIWEYTHR